MKKAFDCVEMKRRGDEKVREAIGGMTVQEELRYWRDRTRRLRMQQKARTIPRKAS